MLLEVVMPTYNGAKYLVQQVETIYEQTLKPDRLLIRDDGSTDGTKKIIQELRSFYGDWICEIEFKDHLGCIGSIGILLAATRARYVAFADQDDIWYPEKLERSLGMIRHMEKNCAPDIPLLVHGDLHLVDEHGDSMGYNFLGYQRLDPRRTQPDDLAVTNVVTGCTCLLNRPLLVKALPIPVEAQMHDWWIALVASVFGQIQVLKEPLIDYRQHGQNLLGAKGVGWGYWLPRFVSLVMGKRQKACMQGVLRQLLAFESRYGVNLSMLPSLAKMPIFERWWVFFRLPACRRPSKHGFLRSAIFYARLLTASALAPDIQSGCDRD